MKASVRVSVKEPHRDKNLEILLFRTAFACRAFFGRLNGQPWPKDGRPASLTRLLAALRKALAKSI